MAKRDREAVNRGLEGMFGSPSGADLISSVLRSDRTRTGRTPSETSDPPSDSQPEIASPEISGNIMTRHTVIEEYDNKTDKSYDHMTSKSYDNKASPNTIKQADTSSENTAEIPERTTKRKERAEKGEGLLGKRHVQATQMAKSGTTTVTLRLPREMNDWLDEYVHRAWPERVKKQELVTEALRMLFARRGRPGEPVVESELLPKGDND